MEFAFDFKLHVLLCIYRSCTDSAHLSQSKCVPTFLEIPGKNSFFQTQRELLAGRSNCATEIQM